MIIVSGIPTATKYSVLRAARRKVGSPKSSV